MAIYVHQMSPADRRKLEKWIESGEEPLRHRARVVLLSHEGYRVPEIARRVEAHPTNLRKWIHRYNEKGAEGLISPRSGGAPVRISKGQKSQIIRLATQSPRELGLPFSQWALHKLAEAASETGIVKEISHEYVRQILLAADVDYRQSAA